MNLLPYFDTQHFIYEEEKNTSQGSQKYDTQNISVGVCKKIFFY